MDARDRASLNNIFKKIPMGMKVKDKFKSKLRNSTTVEPTSPKEGGVLLKAQTNVREKVKVNFKDAMKRLSKKRTKTLQSEDFSDDSSDFDFAANHRMYNKLEKVSDTAKSIIQEGFLGRLEKAKKERDINPLEIDEEREESIQWTMFKQKRTRSKTRKLNPLSNRGGTKKFQMKSLVQNFSNKNSRYMMSERSMKGALSPNLPSISIVPLQNISEKELTNAALRAATNQSQHYMSIQP